MQANITLTDLQIAGSPPGCEKELEVLRQRLLKAGGEVRACQHQYRYERTVYMEGPAEHVRPLINALMEIVRA